MIKEYLTEEDYARVEEFFNGIEVMTIQEYLTNNLDLRIRFSELLLPASVAPDSERLRAFISYGERLRSWFVRMGQREEARRLYIDLMRVRRRWLWVEGLEKGKLGLALRSFVYAPAQWFTNYGEGLWRWFVSSTIMIYLFGFLFLLIDYLRVLSRLSPVFDTGNSNAVGMYFYLSTVNFLGVGFRTLQFDDFLGLFLVDVEFLIGKIMIAAFLVMLFRKFSKQN